VGRSKGIRTIRTVLNVCDKCGKKEELLGMYISFEIKGPISKMVLLGTELRDY
jgi:hypothetical protein